MELMYLGTGEAFDTILPNTSILVNREFLLDCGFNIPQKFWKSQPDPSRLKMVWLSHFHADHTFGLPSLLMRFWEDGRTEPFTVVGPNGVRDYVEKIMELAYGDFFSRFQYSIKYEEAKPGSELQLNGYSLKFADTGHTKGTLDINGKKIQKTSLAIRVSRESKSFTYSGDAPYSEELVGLAKGCGLLIQESYLPLSEKRELMKEGKAANHCSWYEAGEAAHKAGVRQLALVHMCRSVARKIDEAIKEASQAYNGKVLVPQPGDILSL